MCLKSIMRRRSSETSGASKGELLYIWQREGRCVSHHTAGSSKPGYENHRPAESINGRDTTLHGSHANHPGRRNSRQHKPTHLSANKPFLPTPLGSPKAPWIMRSPHRPGIAFGRDYLNHHTAGSHDKQPRRIVDKGCHRRICFTTRPSQVFVGPFQQKRIIVFFLRKSTRYKRGDEKQQLKLEYTRSRKDGSNTILKVK